VALNPSYAPGVEDQLDEIEQDADRSEVWRAIVETLHAIVNEPDHPRHRRFGLTTPDGMIWRVPVPSGREMQNYSILWAPDEELSEAVFLYVGVWPPSEK
jgi:hypothetical protein